MYNLINYLLFIVFIANSMIYAFFLAKLKVGSKNFYNDKIISQIKFLGNVSFDLWFLIFLHILLNNF